MAIGHKFTTQIVFSSTTGAGDCRARTAKEEVYEKKRNIDWFRYCIHSFIWQHILFMRELKNGHLLTCLDGVSVVPRKMTDRPSFNRPFISIFFIAGRPSIRVPCPLITINRRQRGDRRLSSWPGSGCICMSTLPACLSSSYRFSQSLNNYDDDGEALLRWVISRIERYLFINPRKKQKEQPFLSKLTQSAWYRWVWMAPME